MINFNVWRIYFLVGPKNINLNNFAYFCKHLNDKINVHSGNFSPKTLKKERGMSSYQNTKTLCHTNE